ncbi:isopentenyl-diphosphate Delta-isomerase [Amycolatopsis alkalitolerans]|uniref:Isopentenyl-diphosphate Delta-isomerase n=1 Tax=Amycolatopsis alkalitolerans TaxID=2547244 RepID=A0A5C4M377_9PSEU|nr:isopentenyl-diphosphate Delta-isomerase [Amycolatopsis alkalitolerans]TNC26884.1 isopentenyl-diphosphate Delta-isomerase [Amycolatopsis alkalitolerans]
MEQVVLLSESGEANGVQDKAEVHHAETPLHLAFSCYLFGPDGRLLLTTRARTKKTFPGLLTNSCCGHPAPGEDIVASVERRIGQELGAEISDITLVLPRFRYRAVMADGIVENEMCPVFRARTGTDPAPDPSEVDSCEWVDWITFAEDVLAGRRAVSPWCAEQVAELVPLGPDPLAWPAGEEALLPPAARRRPAA